MDSVKGQILIAIEALKLPFNAPLSRSTVSKACDAAKFLRHRLLREHSKVMEKIDSLRQEIIFQDEGNADDVEGKNSYNETDRPEFLFMANMRVADKVLVPLLLIHGLNHSNDLLPQVMKLLAVLLLKVPRFSHTERQQKEILRTIKQECGTDDFFLFLFECILPITEKRTKSNLQREDVILLEVTLTLIAHLLQDFSSDMEAVVGSFCRSNGLEFFVVMINQNFKKANASKLPEQEIPLPNQKHEEETNVIDVEDDEKRTDSDSEKAKAPVEDDLDLFFDQKLREQMQEMLEGSEQLWKWNTLILSALCNVFTCSSPLELAQLSFLKATNSSNVSKLIQTRESFRDCRKNMEQWRTMSQSQGTLFASNTIVVKSYRRVNNDVPVVKSFNGTSSLATSKYTDSAEIMRKIDAKKKGRFVKGLFQENPSFCKLPLLTKVKLASETQNILVFAFQPLSSMVWPRLRDIVHQIEQSIREHRELKAVYKGSGESMEVQNPLDAPTYDSFIHILNYVSVCSRLLAYNRELLSLMKDDKNSDNQPSSFQEQWQRASFILSLDHFECGFQLLRVFLQSKEIRKRADILIVASFLAEMLLMLNFLLEPDVVKENFVEVAVHALASSVLYDEANIRSLFEFLGIYSAEFSNAEKTKPFLLLVYASFQLMEKCSFDGNLLLPKRSIKKKKVPSEDVNNLREEEIKIEKKLDAGEETSLLAPGPPEGGSDDEAPNLVEDEKTRVNEVDRVPPSMLESPDQIQSDASDGEEEPAEVASLLSEREVSIGTYIRRLAQPKYSIFLLSAIKLWRVNDAQVNTGVVYLMEKIIAENCEPIFFSISFFLSMLDILTNAKETHLPLYSVCDKIIYDFFNPSYAVNLDTLALQQLGPDASRALVGARSHLGFEVALRCTRSLFSLSPTDYHILEEKSHPHLLEKTEISLPHDTDKNLTSEKRAKSNRRAEKRKRTEETELTVDLDTTSLELVIEG